MNCIDNVDIKHLFVSDLDGTLLGTDSEVSEESAEIISGLSRRGALITVATARTPATVEPLLRRTFTSIPAIVMTGAALWDRERQAYTDTVMVDPAIIPAIIQMYAAAGVSPFHYQIPSDGSVMRVYHSSDLTRCERRFVDDRLHLKLKKFVFTSAGEPALPYPDTVLIFAMGPHEKLAPIADKLSREPRCSFSFYNDIFNRDLSYIEIFGAGVSKASAISRLARKLGAEKITVYGDNLNDLPMMRIADESVAVANAVDEVRRIADRTIGPNSESSVARDILHTIESA